MDTEDKSQHLIERYVSALMEETGLAQLEEEEKNQWISQLSNAMHKAVTIELINSLAPDAKKRFEDHLAQKDLANALKVLVEENADYEQKMVQILDGYKKTFLEKYLEELKKMS